MKLRKLLALVDVADPVDASWSFELTKGDTIGKI